jgi:HAD superfamily hydrolase (TIGR01509 family)
MIKEYKAFIFDLDGVLVDSEALRIQTYKELFKNNFNVQIEMINADFIGKSEESNLNFLIEKYSLKADINALIKQRKILLEKIAKKKINFNIPIINFLLLAKKMDLSTAICTNSHRDYLKIIMKRLSPTVEVDLLLSKEDVKNSKPDPEIYLMASSMLKVGPEECLVFEDSKPGKEAAKNANMDVIIVPEDVASSIIDIDK